MEGGRATPSGARCRGVALYGVGDHGSRARGLPPQGRSGPRDGRAASAPVSQAVARLAVRLQSGKVEPGGVRAFERSEHAP